MCQGTGSRYADTSRSLRISNRLYKAVNSWQPAVPNARIEWDLMAQMQKKEEEIMIIKGNKQNNEVAIKRVIEDGIEAVCNKDIEGTMALYAPEVVSFDIVPPLRYVGAEVFRTVWEEVFSSFQGPIGYEIHDLTIIASEGVAFAYSLNHISGTLNSGLKTDLWLRWTACFQKINGTWLIVHHQNSVPVDLQHGKAVLDLKP